jgi:hypothetical protein
MAARTSCTQLVVLVLGKRDSTSFRPGHLCEVRQVGKPRGVRLRVCVRVCVWACVRLGAHGMCVFAVQHAPAHPGCQAARKGCFFPYQSVLPSPREPFCFCVALDV